MGKTKTTMSRSTMLYEKVVRRVQMLGVKP